MVRVIPSINCHVGDFECVVSRVRTAEGLPGVELLHLDIADGLFTFHKTWNEPERWSEVGTKLAFEVHLMTEDPEVHVNAWLKAGAKRIIIHVEEMTPELFHDAKGIAAEKGASIMLSSNPETPVEALSQYLKETNEFQVLGVNPGLSGQGFLPRVLKKIEFIRREIPDAVIEVDGGITLETGKKAAEAGANILVSAAHIFGAENPTQAYEELTKLV